MIGRSHRIVGLTMFLCLIFAMTGCKAPKRFDVSVSLDAKSWEKAYGPILPSLEVDLVGINNSEKGNWENYSVNKYFSPGDSLRSDADRVTLTFTNEDRETKLLARKDPAWDRWIGKLLSRQKHKDAKWLFVIANIPGIAQDLPGSQDPRRLILPLALKAWPVTTKRIEVELKSSGITSNPSPKSQ